MQLIAGVRFIYLSFSFQVVFHSPEWPLQVRNDPSQSQGNESNRGADQKSRRRFCEDLAATLRCFARPQENRNRLIFGKDHNLGTGYLLNIENSNPPSASVEKPAPA